MRKLIAPVLFLLLHAAPPKAARAQGIFIDQGQDALGAGLALSSGGGVSAASLGVGYSFGGVIDVGLALHRYRFADYTYLYNPYQIRGTGLSLTSNVTLARQDAGLPFSVGATGGLQKVFFSSDLPRLPGEGMGGWAIWLGGFACKRFPLTDRITATPLITLAATHGSVSHTWAYGRTTASDQSLFLKLDGHFAYKDGGDRLWIVTPFLGFGDSSGGSGLAIGGVFP